MHTIRIAALVLFIVGIASTSLAEDRVIQGKDGISHALYDFGGYRIAYIVDTVAQLCFADHEGLVQISCQDLAKRDEWKPVITWTQQP